MAEIKPDELAQVMLHKDSSSQTPAPFLFLILFVKMKRFVFFVFFLSLLSNALAQFELRGVVHISPALNTLDKCQVTLLDKNENLVEKLNTNSKGSFAFQKVKSGRYLVRVYLSGYTPALQYISVDANTSNLVFELVPLHAVSEEVVIESIKNKNILSSSHTNLDAEDIGAFNIAQDLPSVINSTPGVVSTSDAGTGVGYTGVRIRGVDATRINVTINGVPLNDAESHGVYWVDLPDLAGNIGGLQIQRGIGTSTNGGAAFGSSINIQTTKSSIDPYFVYSTTVGSFSTFKNSVKFGTGLLHKKWTMEGSLSSINSDGYIDRGSSRLKSAFGSISRYGDKSLLKLVIMNGNEVTYQAWYGVPQELLKTNRTYNYYNYKNQTDNYAQTHYQMLYTYAFSPKLNINVVAHYTKGKGYYENYNAYAALAAYSMPDFKITDSSSQKNADIVDRKWLDNDFYGVVTSAVYKQKKYELNAGVSYNNYIGRHYSEVIWSDVWTAPKPNGNFEPFLYANDKGIKNDGNAYFKVYYSLSKKIMWFGDLQLRALNYNFNNTQLNNITKNYIFFNPKAGVNFFFNDSSNLLFYIGRSAHEPTRDEFVNSSKLSMPHAEYLNDIELGYSKHWKHWEYIANAYTMSYDNQLILTGQLNDVGNPVRENVKRSYRRGIELVARRAFKNRFSLNVNISYSKSVILNYKEYVYNETYDTASAYLYAKTPISFSPDLVFGSSLKYKFKSAFEMEFVSKFVSKQFLDNSGSEDRKLDAYFVNDFYVRCHFSHWRIMNNFNFNLVVYNIFSEVYESNGATYAGMYQGVRQSYNYYYPQAPRHFALQMQMKF